MIYSILHIYVLIVQYFDKHLKIKQLLKNYLNFANYKIMIYSVDVKVLHGI